MIRKSQVALGICLGLWLLLEVNIYIYIGVRSSTTSEYWEWLKRVEKHCDRPLRRDCSTVYSTIYLIGVSVKQRAIYKQTSQYRRLRRDTHSESERERERQDINEYGIAVLRSGGLGSGTGWVPYSPSLWKVWSVLPQNSALVVGPYVQPAVQFTCYLLDFFFFLLK